MTLEEYEAMKAAKAAAAAAGGWQPPVPALRVDCVVYPVSPVGQRGCVRLVLSRVTLVAIWAVKWRQWRRLPRPVARGEPSDASPSCARPASNPFSLTSYQSNERNLLYPWRAILV